MTALETVAVHVPPTRLPIGALRETLGLSVPEMKVFQRYFGLAEVPRAEGGLTDLLLGAALGLDPRPARIRYVLYARSVPVVAPYPVNPLHEVTARLGLGHATAFAVTQHACASGLLALDLAGRLLAGGDPGDRALILTGEKTFTPGAMLVPRTSIMGEASTACVVRHGGDRDRVLGYTVRMRGEYDEFGPPDEEAAARFREEYPSLVGELITAALDQAGLRLADLALILPHNVNTISWMRTCDLIGFPADRVLLDNVPVTGHCFCGDGFLNYRTAVDTGRLRPGDHYMIIAVGTGLTAAAMVLRH